MPKALTSMSQTATAMYRVFSLVRQSRKLPLWATIALLLAPGGAQAYRAPFVIEQINGDESDDSWAVDADFYSGLASCEKARAKWLQDDQDAGGTQHSWSSLKCVPYSPAKHGRLDVPRDPEKGSLVTEHSVFYVPMVIGGRSGLLMGGFSSKEVYGDKAECLAEAKKRNESQDGFGPDFKPQQEPQRWEVRCYPFSSTITHHRL